MGSFVDNDLWRTHYTSIWNKKKEVVIDTTNK